MVQREVKRKTLTYALTGILLASVCVAMIYSAGNQTGILPGPSASPGGSEPGGTPIEISPMSAFQSYDELKTFLTVNNQASYSGDALGGDNSFTERSQTGDIPLPMPTAIPSAAPPAAATAGENKDFSTTNIQVAGVDEADTVKTDGNYLYVIANNSIYVVSADPNNAKVISKISIQNAGISGIYLSDDGSKLAVLGGQYTPYVYADWKGTGLAVPELYPYWSNPTMFVYVYDVSNKDSPSIAQNFTMTGSYVNSRRIGDYVYTIVTQNAYVVNGTVILPTVYSERAIATIKPTDIYFANVADSYYTYTTFIAMNIMNPQQAPTNKTIMMGGAGEIYVSPDNIYVTYPIYDYAALPITRIAPSSTPTSKTPENSSSGSSIASDAIDVPSMPIMRTTTPKTAIYRVHISGSSMTFAAQGNVTGTTITQYAMDENGNYLRIATTAYVYDSNTYAGTQQNNVYVLDMNLNTVGKIENLGTGENFKSVRFMGTRCYLVTFMNTDPLFVIDLSQPTQPKLLGELVIPGYSDYLHPYDDTHLIGVGKDAVEDSSNNFAWYQGLKLSLFDVSDVYNPKEIAKISIGDRGTSSEVLYNPKAFLFNRTKNLLVIPVDLYLTGLTSSDAGTGKFVPPPTTSGSMPAPIPTTVPGRDSFASSYGNFAWQGVYVIRVTLGGGFQVQGNITQLTSEMMAKLTQGDYYYGYDSRVYDYMITRSLYIGNTLYTISNARIQMNSLTDLSLLATVNLT